MLDWNGLFAANFHFKKDCFYGLSWHVVFIFTCRFIWKWRWNRIFYVDFKCPYNPIKVILDAAKEWYAASSSFSLPRPKVRVVFHWTEPPSGWFKLNVDGAGEVIRDSLVNGALGLLPTKGFYFGS